MINEASKLMIKKRGFPMEVVEHGGRGQTGKIETILIAIKYLKRENVLDKCKYSPHSTDKNKF